MFSDESGLKQWLVWCDEKIAKFGDVHPTHQPASPAAAKPLLATNSPAVASVNSLAVAAAESPAVALVKSPAVAGGAESPAVVAGSEADLAAGPEVKTIAQPGSTGDSQAQTVQPDLMPVPKIKVQLTRTSLQQSKLLTSPSGSAEDLCHIDTDKDPGCEKIRYGSGSRLNLLRIWIQAKKIKNLPRKS